MDANSSFICKGIGCDQEFKTVNGRCKHQLKCKEYLQNNREEKTGYEKVDNKYCCSRCGKLYSYAQGYFCHKETCGTKKKKVKNSICCTVCHKQFLYQSKPDRHLLSHKNGLAKCQYCNKVQIADKLRNHVLMCLQKYLSLYNDSMERDGD